MSALSYALAACLEYEEWRQEEERQHAIIISQECPKEAEAWERGAEARSCFTVASEVSVAGEEGAVRITLAGIEKLVQDCPSCLALVHAIRARKMARHQLGVAKRKIRHAGKQAMELQEREPRYRMQQDGDIYAIQSRYAFRPDYWSILDHCDTLEDLKDYVEHAELDAYDQRRALDAFLQSRKECAP